MKRSSHKGKGKGTAAPRREYFDDAEDDRSHRDYPIDDAMDVDFHSDRRDERGDDRGGDRKPTRRDDLRDDQWEDRRTTRRDDLRDDQWEDRRVTRRDGPRDDQWDDHRDMHRDDTRGQIRSDRRDDRREDVSEGLITQYFPTTGIEWEVIAGDIQVYLGPEASVRIGPDPDDSRQMAYWVKAKNNTLTQHMLADLKADSLAWKDEKIRDRNSPNQSYIMTQTHLERQKGGPSRRLPIAPPAMSIRPDPYDRHRSEDNQSSSTAFSTPSRAAINTSPSSVGDTFGQSRHAASERLQYQSFLTREDAEQIIARRLRDAGQTGITRSQLNNLIDEALAQASRTQEQVLTREQAQRIIAQRLKDSGQTTVTKSQLEDLINSQMQKSKEKNVDRVVNEAIQKSQERPAANQGRPAVQVTPPTRPSPLPTNPDPDGTFGHQKGPDYSRHSKAG